MYDLDLNQLRDDVDSSITTPPFEELVSRGSRRRMQRIGAVLATGAVVAALGVLVVDKSTVADDSPKPTHHTPAQMTADEIVDADNARVIWIWTGPDGLANSVWTVPCDANRCPRALAWTDDNWETRTTEKISTGDWIDVIDDKLIGFGPVKAEYVQSSDGKRTPVTSGTGPAPTDSWVDAYQANDGRWFTVSVDDAVARPVVLPAKYTIDAMWPAAAGELRANGYDKTGGAVLLISHDGGATWSATPTPKATDLVSDGDDYFGYHLMLGSKLDPPNRVTVSTDGGATWTVLKGAQLPFGTPSSWDVGDGKVLIASAGKLWKSTDDTLLHYALVDGGPMLAEVRIEKDGDTAGEIIGIDPSYDLGWRSTDGGETWSKYEPR